MEVFTCRLGVRRAVEVDVDGLVGDLCEADNDVVIVNGEIVDRQEPLCTSGICAGDVVDVVPVSRLGLDNMKWKGTFEVRHTKLIDIWKDHVVAVTGNNTIAVFTPEGCILKEGRFEHQMCIMLIKTYEDSLVIACTEKYIIYNLAAMDYDRKKDVMVVPAGCVPLGLVESDGVLYKLATVNGVDVQVTVFKSTSPPVTLVSERAARITSYIGLPEARLAYSYDEGVKINCLRTGAKLQHIATFHSALSLATTATQLIALHLDSASVLTAKPDRYELTGVVPIPSSGRDCSAPRVFVAIRASSRLIVVADRYEISVYC